MSSSENPSFTVLAPPVFITGIPRSGTTLLYSSMFSHSHFKSELPEDSIGLNAESKVFMRTRNVFHSGNADRYLINNQAIKNDFLDSTVNIRRYQKIGNKPYEMIFRYTSHTALRKMSFKLGLNHIVLRKYFQYAKAARMVKRIVEKTPHHIMRIPEIRATFPNAKCIFLYRHPVDVISSFRKRLKLAKEHVGEPEGLDWLKVSIEDFCRKYKDRIRAALCEVQSDQNENFMMLKYEDLVSQPYEAFQKICSFIDEPFEEQMIPEGESAKKAKYSEFLGGRIVAKTKDWGDFLTQDDAKLVEDKLSELMNVLDYGRYT